LSQRLTALILLPSLLYFLTALIYMTHCFEYPVYNLESISLMFIALTLRGWADGIILFGVLVLCFLHLVEGAQSIVDDYVHEECTKTLVGFVFGV
jgi:succinate dehydrogenase hydrophobic anchor subunit